MTKLLPFFYLLAVYLMFSLLPTQAKANLADDYKMMTTEQKQVLKKAYEHGKPFDLGYTLASIAWQESSCGKYMVNVFDPSFGIYHIQTKNAVSFTKVEDTKFNHNRVAMLLIDDFDYSSAICISVLRWWINYHKGSWSKAVSSYNGGFKGSKVYLRKIRTKIRFLKGIIK